MEQFITLMFAGGLAAWLLPGCGQPAEPAATSEAGKAPAATPLPYHQVIEAESATVADGDFAEFATPGASAGACLRIAPSAEKKAFGGSAEFAIELPKAQQVSIWFRTRWGGTCANSFELVAPAGPLQLIGEDGTYGAWHWVKGSRLPLAAGKNVFVMKPREPDVQIDQIVVTADEGFVPMGVEQ